MSEDDKDKPNLKPELSDISSPDDDDDDDKYEPSFSLSDKTESGTMDDKKNFPTTASGIKLDSKETTDTLDEDKTNVNVDTMDTKNEERRRNNRLQSGATKDKFSNAHRFPGGHEKANADRPKPLAVDQNISTGNNYSQHNSGSQRENHRHVDRNSRGRHGSPHRSFVHKETEDFVFFWREGSPFSQWHPAKFKVDDLEFNCAEQYMMYSKAKAAKNDAIAEMILTERDPRAQKGYGRQIPEFDGEMWEKKREEVVKKGNMAKFSQNPDLQAKLVETYPKTLVEASPVDHIWGIGLSAYDNDARTKETWKGLNLLGKILTEVRDDILKELEFL